jgi:hypothetical protein
MKRLVAKREMKHGLALCPARLPIAIGHRQLIKVRQQGQRRAVKLPEVVHGVAFFLHAPVSVIFTLTGRRDKGRADLTAFAFIRRVPLENRDLTCGRSEAKRRKERQTTNRTPCFAHPCVFASKNALTCSTRQRLPNSKSNIECLTARIEIPFS